MNTVIFTVHNATVGEAVLIRVRSDASDASSDMSAQIVNMTVARGQWLRTDSITTVPGTVSGAAYLKHSFTGMG